MKIQSTKTLKYYPYLQTESLSSIISCSYCGKSHRGRYPENILNVNNNGGNASEQRGTDRLNRYSVDLLFQNGGFPAKRVWQGVNSTNISIKKLSTYYLNPAYLSRLKMKRKRSGCSSNQIFTRRDFVSGHVKRIGLYHAIL